MVLTLFSTDSCHLCELAQAVLLDVSAQCQDLEVYLEDIGESEEAVERYGLRIPVLRHDDSGQELDWPFDTTGCLSWLSSF